ncbi:symmetrical bis(5'-nucleosyl)-tetraphosphatase [Thiohalorhabdus methylotrophus]|uniref:bis(5'-nucleosyl)-tetraphosphatase (symmetrical) n=1 Tax=Thiohalorhabdus methylotrophus TaxID=3242694 RepID=A0ABV4TS19_9GAMM
MAVYAVGDIQGCGEELEGLLDRIGFEPGRDRLWVVGDLVNRGPRSLHVLRRLRQLGDAVRIVLGNHDLHLIALAHGLADMRGKDTVGELLEAEDGPELVAWLRRQPLLHSEGDPGWTMVHAALHPAWDLEEAHRRAEAVAETLRGPRGPELAGSLSSKDLPTSEPDPDREWQWLRFNAAVLTRTRFCTADGEFAWGGTAPAEPRFQAWYAHPERRSRGTPIVYGHWAADGLTRTRDTLGLDSGCVWGGALTAARLDADPVTLWEWDCRGYWVPDGT